MMTRILAAVLLFASAFAAQAESMTLAERRIQRAAIAERTAYVAPPVIRERSQPAAGSSWSGHEDPGTIVIETGARLLHYVADNGAAITYSIAVGKEGAQWTGTTHVTDKRRNPEWRPTPNMRRRDPSLPAVVRPGPRNPMGVRAIYLAQGYLRIHGTNAPGSIGTAASSGCFRMHNDDVTDLYERVSPGAKVVVLD